MFCCALLCVNYSFAIISVGKRELAALLCLSSWCLMSVMWFLFTMPWVCLQFVVVVFPNHTHFLYFIKRVEESDKCIAFFETSLIDSIIQEHEC